MTEQPSANKLAKTLERVRLLLARADHPNTPPAEADLSRQQAEKLIERYRLDEQELADSGQVVLTPSWRDIRLVQMNNEFTEAYRAIAYYAVRHVDCDAVTSQERDPETGDWWYVLRVVGYESDLRFADLLVTECMAAFGAHLEPKYDRNETEAANAYRMRKGGMERGRIGVILFGHSATVNEMKAKNRKVTKLIKEEAQRRGEDVNHLLGRNVNIKTYRQSFANGFVNEIYWRLQRAAQARSEEGALVLANRKEVIREALYERYPHLRPQPEARALGEGTAQADCPKCKAAKSGYCRDHTYLRPRKSREQAWSAAGYSKGREAARTVNLGGAGKPKIEGR